MVARIYKPARNVMQSGKANTKQWLLEFESKTPRGNDPLMGWTSSNDTRQQIRLAFATREDAVAYATREGLAYRVETVPPVRGGRKSYSDNFRWGRTENWTH